MSTILLFPLLVMPSKAFSVDAGAAIVMEAETGTVLFEQNAYSQLSMASTTKIMTALLALEQPALHEEFIVDENAIMVEGSSMGLVAGDTVTLHALAVGMLTSSGNDAAGAAAVKIGGSHEGFATMMNERAKAIGMTQTNFVTPSGLDDDEHYSTAYDMALLGREAMKNEDFYDISSSLAYKTSFGNPPYERTLTNHNKLLTYYEHTVGIKTGFTEKSGRCLVSAAEKDGITLIVVTLNCGDDWNIHETLYEMHFPMVTTADITHPTDLSIAVTGGTDDSVGLVATEDFSYIQIKNRASDISYKIFSTNFAYSPIKKGDILGKIVYYINDEEIGSCDLVAESSIEPLPTTEKSFNDKLQQFYLDCEWGLLCGG